MCFGQRRGAAVTELAAWSSSRRNEASAVMLRCRYHCRSIQFLGQLPRKTAEAALPIRTVKVRPNFLPRNGANPASSIFSQSAFNFSGPRFFRVRIALLFHTFQQQAGKFGTLLRRQFRCFLVQLSNSSTHMAILRARRAFPPVAVLQAYHVNQLRGRDFGEIRVLQHLQRRAPIFPRPTHRRNGRAQRAPTLTCSIAAGAIDC
jgi:hypothetical protein